MVVGVGRRRGRTVLVLGRMGRMVGRASGGGDCKGDRDGRRGRIRMVMVARWGILRVHLLISTGEREIDLLLLVSEGERGVAHLRRGCRERKFGGADGDDERQFLYYQKGRTSFG